MYKFAEYIEDHIRNNLPEAILIEIGSVLVVCFGYKQSSNAFFVAQQINVEV